MARRWAPGITTAQRLTVTLAEREFVFDTDLDRYFIGDGSTVGGLRVANHSELTAADAAMDARVDDLEALTVNLSNPISAAMAPVVQASIDAAMELLDQGDFTATGSTTARSLADRFAEVVVQVATKAALKEVDPDKWGYRAALVLSRATAGDRGGGWFRWDGSNLATKVSADPQEGVYVHLTGEDGSTGAWVRVFDGAAVWAEWFGADNTGVAPSAAKINAARDLVLNLWGGGAIRLGPGTFLLENTNSGAASEYNYRGIYIGNDNIEIEGSGPRSTILKIADSANANAIQVGQGATVNVGVSHVRIGNLQIDGNRANQVTPDDLNNHHCGIIVYSGDSGAQDVVIENVYIHHTQYYAIGFQGAKHHIDCAVRRALMEDTGADGFDAKDNPGDSYGNAIEDITVRRFGLVSGLTFAQAGVDVRPGWSVRGAVVEDFGSAKGLHGIRYLQAANSGLLADQGSSFSDFYVKPTTTTNTVGLYMDCIKAVVFDGEVYGCGVNADIKQREAQISSLVVADGVIGLRLDTSAGATNATDVMMSGVKARGHSDVGIEVDGVDDAILLGCICRGNNIGIRVNAGADRTKIVGCTLANTTSELVDNGTDTLPLHSVGAGIDKTLMRAGEWTPVASFATNGDFLPTYALQDGDYIAFGRTVIAYGTLEFDTNAYTTASGEFRITGLPFMAQSSGGRGTGPVGRAEQVDIGAGQYDLHATVNVSVAYITLRAKVDDAVSIVMDTTNFPASTNGYRLDFSVTHKR